MARLNTLPCTLILCAALHSGQAAAQYPAVPDAEPSAAAFPVAAQANDPYERYNRFMFAVNDTADRYVLSPAARGYRAALPAPVRQGVSNFFDNLRDVVSFGSNVLRADLKRAGEDFIRVGINSTFGIGGLINIANAGGIPDNKNTLGDTFASWGWKNSNYFVPPLMGPSTVRDTVGSVITAAYPVHNAVFATTSGRIAAAAANTVDTRAKLLPLTDSLDGAAIDKYAYIRDFYMSVRNKQTGNLPETEEEIDIDNLVEPDSEAAPSENSGFSDGLAEQPAADETNSETADSGTAYPAQAAGTDDTFETPSENPPLPAKPQPSENNNAHDN